MAFNDHLISKKIIIAIDGYSGCGKSTLARDLSKKLSYIHIDTGAMYRAIALHFLQTDTNLSNVASVSSNLQSARLMMKIEDEQSCTFLNGVNVVQRIKEPDVASIVSEVAALKEVRAYLLDLQQSFGRNKGIVMDGRDIGTVIFPGAELKLFVTADIDVRTQRRLLELKEKGHQISATEIKENLLKRDRIDSSRAVAPLKQANDAILFDTSFLSREGQLEKALLEVNRVLLIRH